MALDDRNRDRDADDGERAAATATATTATTPPNRRRRRGANNDDDRVEVKVHRRTPTPRRRADDEDESGEEEGSSSSLLFSCRCESARSVTTLLSCLRHFAAGSGSGDGGGGGATATTGPSSQRGRDLSTSAVADPTHGDRGGAGGGKSRGGGGGRAQQATVYASPGALTFHVHGLARQSQASVDMQAGLFSDFHVAEETVETGALDPETDEPVVETLRGGEFCVNLTTVLECLHVLGPSNLDKTKLCLSYDTRRAILKIELEEPRGVLATCAVAGSVPAHEDEYFEEDDEDGEAAGAAVGVGSSSLAIAFRRDAVVARAIVKSDYLRDAVAELADVGGATCCTIGIAPNRIELGTVGHAGECLVDLPRAPEVFVSLECNPPTLHARSYPLNSLLQGMRGLEIANETCVSINARGMIAIQHQVLDMVGSGQPNFIDFLMGAIQEDDEDDDEGEDEGGNDEDEEEKAQRGSGVRRGSARGRSPPRPGRTKNGDNVVVEIDGDDEDGEGDGGGEESEAESEVDPTTRGGHRHRDGTVPSPPPDAGGGSAAGPPSSGGEEHRHSPLNRGSYYSSDDTTENGDDGSGGEGRSQGGRRLEEGSESPELLFGGTRLLPAEPSATEASMRRPSRRRRRGYSDDDTDENEF